MYAYWLRYTPTMTAPIAINLAAVPLTDPALVGIGAAATESFFTLGAVGT